MRYPIMASILLTLAFLAQASLAAEPNEPSAKWESISEGVLADLEKAGAKIGFPGMTGGIAVDPASGDVYMVICDQGLWKSTDHGTTFARCDGKAISGRCETGWAANVDPAGGRLAMFMVYANGAATDDSGKTWAIWKNNHFDAGAVDWENGGRTLLAMKHESGGDLALSTDAGATWRSLGKGFAPVLGAWDDKTFVACKGKELLRTQDGGATWETVQGVIVPQTAVVRIFKGTAYLVSSKGVQISTDKGKTWSVMGVPVEALFGPFFKDESTIMVVTPKGFALTQDGGKEWRIVAPLPPFATGEYKFDARNAWFPNFGWDPQANILYAAVMGKPAYKCALAPMAK